MVNLGLAKQEPSRLLMMRGHAEGGVVQGPADKTPTHRLSFYRRPIWMMGAGFAALLLWVIFRTPGEDSAIRSVDACDVQASFTDDPSRMAPGVDMAHIVPGLAIEACAEAVRRHGQVGRFRLELARAYSAAGDKARAMSALNGATSTGYPAAWLELGRVYVEGRMVAPDMDKAADAFRRAGAGGIDVTDELRGVTFNAGGFSDPAFMKAIWTMTPLNGKDHAVRIYLQQFVSEFHDDDKCNGLVEQSTFAKLTISAEGGAFVDIINSLVRAHKQGGDPFVAGVGAAQDSVGNMVLNAASADRDAKHFVDAFGCNTLVARQFFANLRDLVAAM